MVAALPALPFALESAGACADPARDRLVCADIEAVVGTQQNCRDCAMVHNSLAGGHEARTGVEVICPLNISY